MTTSYETVETRQAALGRKWHLQYGPGGWRILSEGSYIANGRPIIAGSARVTFYPTEVAARAYFDQYTTPIVARD